jgi:prepilin-type processing-associated H-X9-DG protein
VPLKRERQYSSAWPQAPTLAARAMRRSTCSLTSSFIAAPLSTARPTFTSEATFSFLALARLSSLEQLRYRAPGEWSKLLGLDRIPEVLTIRKKLALLSDQEQVNAWSAELCAQWMGEDPDQASVLYVDGHVRVYHGSQTQLPRHYVARQKLCLRATTDYWVNAMDGQPFFLLNQAVDPGLLQVLEHQIVPRLEETIPNQPTTDALAADANLHRFTLIFDREGYRQ